MTAIAIFVKTPGYSPIKTRLAASIGQDRAEAWHRLAAAAVAELAEQAAIGPVYFAVAEPEAIGHYLWSGLPNLEQGAGDLGRRLHAIHTQLVDAHGSALLLGADTIQWQPTWLRRARDWMQDAPQRWIMGPARDGGFWTFGANFTLPVSSWTAVPYSRSDTRSRLCEQLGQQGPTGRGDFLPVLTDLDRIEDLPTILDEFMAYGTASPAVLAAVDCLRAMQSQSSSCRL